MRYMILTYYKKANGQIDESVAVSKNLKNRDIQTANVILDFKNLRVEKCSMSGQQVPRDWDKIFAYYYQHYQTTMDRLLRENGYEIAKENTDVEPSNPS